MKMNEPIYVLANRTANDLRALNYVFGHSTDFRDERLDILINALDIVRDIRDEATQGGVMLVQL